MNLKSAVRIGNETPFMVVDEDQTRKNIKEMQKIAGSSQKRLRPHSKTHKIPQIAKWQIKEGAVGICVQKVSEAEVMFEGGIEDILVSNEIVDTRKTDRIARLIAKGSNVSVVLDSIVGAKALSKSASKNEVEIPVLIDLDLGMHRCGIPPSTSADFYDSILNMKGLRFQGVMGYDGNVKDESYEKREMEVLGEAKILSESLKALRQVGAELENISVGGTPSALAWSKQEVVNELQPGTYVYYDLHCNAMNLCTQSEVSMGVVTQVMSQSQEHPNRVVLDAGYKAISLDQGIFPQVFDEERKVGHVISMSEEHTVIELVEREINIGDNLLMLPYHACTTTDYWDNALLFSNSHPTKSIQIKGRGRRE